MTDRSDWPLVGLVALELLAARLLLFSVGYRPTARALAVGTKPLSRVVRPLTRVAGSDLDPETVARTVETVAGRLPVRTTCLSEALVCKALLDERGVDTDLQVGVAKDGNALEAHAWLVHRGDVLLGATDAEPDRFRRITQSFEP